MIFSTIAIVLALLFTFLFLFNQYMKVKWDVLHHLPYGTTRSFIGFLLFTTYLNVFLFITYYLLKLI